MSAANEPDADSPLQFPCRFPIKVMGRQHDSFESHVIGLITDYVGEDGTLEVTRRPSSNGNFLSVTVTITATSRTQLDQIYQQLTASDQVLMVL
jgi:putative lipoic acid-binding regulatory protein